MRHDLSCNNWENCGGISIHAPLAGCDRRHRHRRRIPRISIHAPLAGCDVRHLCQRREGRQHFNPRTPRGVRLPAPGAGRPAPDFNPRTPRGVRLRIISWLDWGAKISIHAPLAGCDVALRRNKLHIVHISIHAPLAGCDRLFSLFCLPVLIFQSTHPSRGATSGPLDFWASISISIHAPLAGCDGIHRRCSDDNKHFNPRTPRGVRHAGAVGLIPPLEFQSTHPSRGATHHSKHPQSSNRYFNPRTPRGVRLCELPGARLQGEISIHAPLAGCDDSVTSNMSDEMIFQSTHPSRGATRFTRKFALYLNIFQSTHPSRGATADMIPALRTFDISIHAPLAGCDFATS